MSNDVITKQISVGDFFCYGKGVAINSCLITEVREKAVKVDICTEGVWGIGGVIIYTKSAWIPKSVLYFDERGMLEVKKWFVNRGTVKTYPIKNYFIKDNKKVFC